MGVGRLGDVPGFDPSHLEGGVQEAALGGKSVKSKSETTPLLHTQPSDTVGAPADSGKADQNRETLFKEGGALKSAACKFALGSCMAVFGGTLGLVGAIGYTLVSAGKEGVKGLRGKGASAGKVVGDAKLAAKLVKGIVVGGLMFAKEGAGEIASELGAEKALQKPGQFVRQSLSKMKQAKRQKSERLKGQGDVELTDLATAKNATVKTLKLLDGEIAKAKDSFKRSNSSESVSERKRLGNMREKLKTLPKGEERTVLKARIKTLEASLGPTPKEMRAKLRALEDLSDEIEEEGRVSDGSQQKLDDLIGVPRETSSLDGAALAAMFHNCRKPSE